MVDISMVYGRYIYILSMAYKPTYNWGGAPPCVDLLHKFKM